MLRSQRAWRALSKELRSWSPRTWQGLVKGWGRAAEQLQPVQLQGERYLSSWQGRRRRDSFSQVETFVMFAGHPRSGHTVVASLLNAHPDVVIGHRLRVARYLAAGFSRDQLYAMVLLADRRFERLGRVSSKRYNYSVPGQWQGRFRTLKVLGDGDVATGPFSRRPDLLESLRATTGAQVRIIHVVRNPFDNITTIAIRYAMSLGAAVERYFVGCDRNAVLRDLVGASCWIDLRHEDLLGDPEASLQALCEFVGVEVSPDYLTSAAGILYDRPHRSRQDLVWTTELIDQVTGRLAAYPALSAYSFHEAQASKE